MMKEAENFIEDRLVRCGDGWTRAVMCLQMTLSSVVRAGGQAGGNLERWRYGGQGESRFSSSKTD